MLKLNFLLPGLFSIYVFHELMSFRFAVGFGSGLYLGSMYNLKPIIETIETEVRTKLSEFDKQYRRETSGGSSSESSWSLPWSTKTEEGKK